MLCLLAPSKLSDPPPPRAPGPPPPIQDDRTPTNLEHDLLTFELEGRRIASTFQDLDANGRGDLILVTIGSDPSRPERRIRIHRMARDGSLPAEPSQVLSVPAEAVALLFGDYTADPGVEIGFVTRNGVIVYPKKGATLLEPPTRLIYTRTFFGEPSPSSLPVWSWGDDLNGDGRSDLLIPTPDGITLYMQTEPGIYGRITRLESGVPQDKALERVLRVDAVVSRDPLQPHALTVRRSLPRLFSADIDSNGTRDLIAFDGGWMRYYFQEKDGSFPTTAGVAERVVTLETDSNRELDNIASAQFSDIDGDGNQDLIVTKVRGKLDNPQSFIYIHFGSGYGIFREDYVFQLGGISQTPGFIDLDGDGHLDVVTHVTRADKVGRILTALFKEIEVNYKIYQFLPDQRGFDRSTYQETILVKKSAFNKGGLASVSRLEFRTDWTGNGRVDKIRLDPDGRMRVYEGRPTADKKIGFTRSPVYTRRLPRQPPYTYYADFNGDGKMDAMLMGPSRVELLMSK